MTSAYDDRSRRELTKRKAVEKMLRRETVEARDRVLLDEAQHREATAAEREPADGRCATRKCLS